MSIVYHCRLELENNHFRAYERYHGDINAPLHDVSFEEAERIADLINFDHEDLPVYKNCSKVVISRYTFTHTHYNGNNVMVSELFIHDMEK